MIAYRQFGIERIEEVYRIYEENGWTSYLGDKEKLIRAFERSSFLLGAFDEDRLIGFVRCVGDGEYIVHVQDLILLPTYRRQGIGRMLMKQTSDHFPAVRQFMLITDRDDETANAFYRAIGLTEDFNGYPINHYFRKG
ncbi:MAG: GNAT family N-acetyltransferase [Erysipelotrichaceae bacterium]|nr:GNAT family N-acetyltransferase [Erysipelotrichaceae bacterium]